MKNITSSQETILRRHRRKFSEGGVRWNESHGSASMLKGRLGSHGPRQHPRTIFNNVIQTYGPLLGPTDPERDYRYVDARKRSRGGKKIRGVQIVEGIPVYGAAVTVFTNQKNEITRVLNTCWRDIQVDEALRLEVDDLRKILSQRLQKDENAKKFENEYKEITGDQDEWLIKNFPLTSRPAKWLHATARGFHHAFHVHAYQPVNWLGVDGRERSGIGQVELMFDAVSGEILWEEPTREGMAYTDATGSGLSTMEDDSGNHLVRTLQIVRENGGDYFLINRDQTPHIITHDMGGSSNNLETKLKNGNDISQDAGANWNQTTDSCTEAQRIASQQPEVDAHFYAEQRWNFYHNYGWDGFDNGLWGDHCNLLIATHIGIDANAFFDKYLEWDANLGANKYYGYLGFYDGECDGGSLYADFIAGDLSIFGHEYQHAITFFGASKSTGDPGHLYGTTWLGAIREGLSDSFGCLLSGQWINPAPWREGVLRSGDPFRRVEFPRSTDNLDGSPYFDHYDDRNSLWGKYYLSTILSHNAFLVGEGGIHQRTSRDAELIPVVSVGRERTAEIFLHALTEFFDQIPTNLDGPTLIEAGRFLLDAAEEVSGSNRTCEYVMLRRALYATGLHPYDDSYVKQTYGGEACMLPWTISWQRSRPYLGFPALWYKSPDLFINNGSGAEYDADVGVENSVYARVRNIGDQDLNNVRVRFYFRAYGSGLPADMTAWKPCQDSTGNDCILDIPVLAAGSMNFTDVDAPPAGQAVHWYLDPAAVNPDVDHFCIRAEIECSAPNHDNDCPFRVQSNVQYVESDEIDDGFTMMVNNPEPEPIRVDLDIQHTLPKTWKIQYAGDKPLDELRIKKGEEVPLRWKIKRPSRIPGYLEPPFDGKIAAKVAGEVSGILRGEISDTRAAGRIPVQPTTMPVRVKISARVSGRIEEKFALTGRFRGDLEIDSGKIEGILKADIGSRKGFKPGFDLKLEGCIEPLRSVHISQRIWGKDAGGVTLKLKVKRLPNQCNPDKWLP